MAAGAALLLLAGLVGTAFYFSYAQLIEARLRGERERTTPQVYARPMEVRVGQSISQPELVSRLNGLGYAERVPIARPGEFTAAPGEVRLMPRSGEHQGRIVRVMFTRPRARLGSPLPPPAGVRRIEIAGRRATSTSVELDAPVLTALMTSEGRQKRRDVPLATIPTHMQQAVLAIEDQSFYSHPGINPLRLAAAAISNLTSERRVPIGNSTLTQQLARMFFQADAFNAELQRGSRSYLRYVQGAFMSLVLERRATKAEILELYLNDVYLGQRGSFAIHGVAEAARLFFGKDVANLTIGEAALIAGVIQSPASRSPFSNAERAVERRNVVLTAMAGEGFITGEEAARAQREPLRVVARAVDNEAPYFVDMIAAQIADAHPGLTARPGELHIYTTLDLNLQRAALDAVRTGMARVDEQLARRRRTERPQVALVAVDPRDGEIRAMVGGRSYNASQFNRVLAARRQPGSVFKPFVYLAAFEHGARSGRVDLTPASIALDEPRIFEFDGKLWEPQNFDEYDGAVTWRRALSLSRNLATIHVGEQIGFDTVAALWRRVGVGTPPQGVPSITLGVFELTPLEVAQAYTLFVNGGAVRPLSAVARIESGGRPLDVDRGEARRVARADTTYLVTSMMRSVLDEGTAASARAAGFAHDAAGKTGTTNDLRDAWFVGFTPELLTVVWVGYDDNQPLSLTGSQAALPIWTEFMTRALAGRESPRFDVPDGITYAEIDRDTGLLATPGCPGTRTETFLAGTEPTAYCPFHGQ